MTIVTSKYLLSKICNFTAGVLFIILWYATFYVLIPGETVTCNYIFYGIIIPFILNYTDKINKESTKKPQILALLFSIIISTCLTCGFSIARAHDFSLCFGSIRALIIWGLKLLLYLYVFYNITLYLINKAENTIDPNNQKKNSLYSNQKLFLIFFASKIPYLILFYPCAWTWDDVSCLKSFTPPQTFSNWHPFCVSLIQKIFFDIGNTIGNPSIGFALFSTILFIISSAIMVYSIRIIERLGISIKHLKYVIAIYAFFPIYPLISMSISKDGLFTYSIMLFVIILLDILIRNLHNQKISKSILLVNSITALIICFSRHQGIYIVILQFFAMIFVYKKQLKFWIITYTPVILIYFTTTHYIYPAFNIVPTSKGEALGNIFQQSALSFIRNPKHVSTQEKETFKNVIDIAPDTINRCFSYYCTDNIKGKYKYTPSKKTHLSSDIHLFESKERNALNYYLKTYLITFKKNYDSYILAELNIVNMFFYNDHHDFKENRDRRRFLWMFYEWKTNPKLTPECDFYANTSFYRDANNLFMNLSWCPIMEFFFSWFCYSWAIILCLFILCSRKDIKGMVSFLPIFLSLLILFICPMAHFRYFLPLLVGIPLLITYTFHTHDIR